MAEPFVRKIRIMSFRYATQGVIPSPRERKRHDGARQMAGLLLDSRLRGNDIWVASVCARSPNAVPFKRARYHPRKF